MTITQIQIYLENFDKLFAVPLVAFFQFEEGGSKSTTFLKSGTFGNTNCYNAALRVAIACEKRAISANCFSVSDISISFSKSATTP